jgi:hypothetical protein
MYKLGIISRGVVELCDPDLLQVGHAEYPLGPLFGTAQGRQQQRGQNGNDGDHYQQLDEREALASFIQSCSLSLLGVVYVALTLQE